MTRVFSLIYLIVNTLIKPSQTLIDMIIYPVIKQYVWRFLKTFQLDLTIGLRDMIDTIKLQLVSFTPKSKFHALIYLLRPL